MYKFQLSIKFIFMFMLINWEHYKAIHCSDIHIYGIFICKQCRLSDLTSVWCKLKLNTNSSLFSRLFTYRKDGALCNENKMKGKHGYFTGLLKSPIHCISGHQQNTYLLILQKKAQRFDNSMKNTTFWTIETLYWFVHHCF